MSNGLTVKLQEVKSQSGTVEENPGLHGDDTYFSPMIIT